MEMQSSFKLSLALLLLSLPAASALAAPVAAKHVKDYKETAVAFAAQKLSFAGWSAGLGLGLNTFMVNTTATSTVTATESPFISGGVPGSIFNNYGRANIYKFGPMGNLFFGYGYMNDIYYIGMNAGVNILGANSANLNQASNSNITTTSTDGNLSVLYTINNLQTSTKVSRGWAEPFLDLKIGGLITPETLAYVIGGISFNRATVKSSSTYVSNGSIDTIFGPPPAVIAASSTSSFGYSENKNMWGLRVGAGMEVLLTQSFGVAADYIYSFYPNYNSSFSGTGSSVTCDAVGGCIVIPATVTNNTKTVLSDQQVMAKFIYHID
jgi:opacity protein-like surface antigen